MRWHYYDPLDGDYDWYVQIDDVLVVSDEPCPWLTVTPAFGSVPPLGAFDLGLDFDATNLVTGTYACDVLVQSNAENTPVLVVPVALAVFEDLDPPAITCTAAPITCRPGGPNPNSKGDDDDDDDEVGCVRLQFSATDESDFVISAVIETDCAQIPVVDGEIFHLQCPDPDPGEHEEGTGGAQAPNRSQRKKRCHPQRSDLRVAATDEFGNTGVCTLQLCELFRAPATTTSWDDGGRVFTNVGQAKDVRILYTLDRRAHVRLAVYNVLDPTVALVTRGRNPSAISGCTGPGVPCKGSLVQQVEVLPR